MNLFRSEEHIRNWSGFEPGSEDGIVPLDDLVKLFSGNYFRRRLDSDWVSRSREYAREMVKTFKEIGKTGPFWQLPR
jgi:two-component SAPR family response regulator